MVWLFSSRWSTRSDLIEHLVSGNGIKTLKHCMVGNSLWCVHEHAFPEGTRRAGEVTRFVCLYMMQCDRSRGRDDLWWGYKDVDETMGPYQTSCPASYLRMCTYPINKYSYDWRQTVYALETKKKQKWKEGDKFRFRQEEFRVEKLLGNRGVVAFSDAHTYRFKKSMLLNVERITA